MDTCCKRNAHQLPPNWGWERFTPVLLPGGVVAFHSSRNNRFMRMNGNKRMDASGTRGANAIPPGWTWERFKILDLGLPKQDSLRALRGHWIALHCEKHNRYVRMNNKGRMDVSPYYKYGSIPSDWEWERFMVVYAGHGQYAFHNRKHNRFIRLNNQKDQHKAMDASGKRPANRLPGGWTWERFKIVDAGDGQVAFYNKKNNRFMRMDGKHKHMDGSGKKNSPKLPNGWTWEKFRILDLGLR
jgi:hypothetical protein